MSWVVLSALQLNLTLDDRTWRRISKGFFEEVGGYHRAGVGVCGFDSLFQLLFISHLVLEGGFSDVLSP